MTLKRKIRMGMIGGGGDAFIGAVHRRAANLDGEIELVCGAFSSSPEKTKATGEILFIDENRLYGSYVEMIEKESQLPEDERMDFVSIVTPNHVHFEPAKLALEAGFHVMIDKPLAFSLDEANQLADLVASTGLEFGITYTYTGYPMAKHARHMVSSGEIGKVKKVYVEYPQGWLSTELEASGNKQAGWRTDPARSGKSGCMGDIGTHCENMVEFVTGLEIDELSAQLNIVGANRSIDDDGAVLLRYNNGATGVLMASQIATGEENAMKIRVYGEKAGLEWSHGDPNTLYVKPIDSPKIELRAGANQNLCDASVKNSRLPSGHPEGYIEAFANLYRNFARTIGSKVQGEQPDKDLLDTPNVHSGVRGMKFIDRIIESSENGGAWTKF